MRPRLLAKSVACVCWDPRLEQVSFPLLRELKELEQVSFCFLKEPKYILPCFDSPTNCAMLCLVRGHVFAGVGNGKDFLE